MIKLLKVSLVTGLSLFINFSSVAANNWSEAPAEITIVEYLENQFKYMESHASDFINSYSLVSFYPSGDPETAFVLMIQTWHDTEVTERDLRREVRKFSDLTYNHFESIINLPRIKKRWNPSMSNQNFIIKHVRYTDLNETLGVTVDGETYFDNQKIKKIADSVQQRGGVWQF